MKQLLFAVLLALTACGPESSPEGRMGIKLDAVKKELDSLNSTGNIQKQIDSLKQQNGIILDSLDKISKELTALKQKK